MPEPDLLSMIFEDAPEPVAHAQELAAAAPAPPRPLQQPFGDRPWHEQFADVAGDVVGTPQFTAAEHVGGTALGGLDDEAQAGYAASQPNADAWTRAKMGPPPGSDNTYPHGGSEQEDIRRTLEAERGQRDRQNPKSAIAGNVLGAAATGAALPETVAGQVAGSAGLVGAQLMGEGSGPIEERYDQATDQVKEHPYQTAIALGAPLVGAGVTKGASKFGEALTENANKNTVAAFTTAPQRAAIEANGGRGAIQRLGANVRKQGLHKQPWPSALLPPNATTFYNNAVKGKQAGAEALEKAESKIIASGDPNVQIEPIAQDLDDAATEVSKRMDQGAAKPEAKFMRERAQDVRDVGTQPAEGPTQAFYEDQPFTTKGGERDFVAPSREAVEQPFTTKGGNRTFLEQSQELGDPGFTSKGGPRSFEAPSVEAVEPPFFPSGAGRQAPPAAVQDVPPQDWFDYLKKAGSSTDLPPPPQARSSPSVFEGPERPPEFQPGPTKTFTAEGPARPPEFQEGPQKTFTAEGPERPPEFEKGPEKEFKAEGPDREPLITGMGEPPTAQTGQVPFSQALTDLRYTNRNIDHTRTGGGPDAPMQEQVRRRVAAHMREQIDKGLDTGVGTGQLTPDVVKDWKAAKEQYGTAAAVEDPALPLMAGEYGGSMGLKDLAGSSMMSAFGMPGPAAVATSAGMKGRWPGFKANQAAHGAAVATEIGEAAPSVSGAARQMATPHPITQAKQENPGAPKQEVVQKANDSLKQQLQEAMKEGSSWFRHLLD